MIFVVKCGLTLRPVSAWKWVRSTQEVGGSIPHLSLWDEWNNRFSNSKQNLWYLNACNPRTGDFSSYNELHPFRSLKISLHSSKPLRYRKLFACLWHTDTEDNALVGDLRVIGLVSHWCLLRDPRDALNTGFRGTPSPTTHGRRQ